MTLEEYLAQVDLAYKTCSGGALEARLTALTGQCAAEYGPRSGPYASMLEELGSFYRGQCRYEESEEQFRRALPLLEADPGRDSPAYATALNNLAGAHRLLGRYGQALEEFHACLELYRAAVGERHVLYAAGLNNLSLVHLDLGELERALELQEQAADILAAQPQARYELASALCNQGTLCQRLGRLEEAEHKLERALALFREELGTDDPHYHAALNSLGTVHYAAKRFAAARDYFAQAAQAAQALYGPDHRETQTALAHQALAEEGLNSSPRGTEDA